jgi:hypothetical protein
LVCVFFPKVVLACPADQLEALEPYTQKSVCLLKFQEKILSVVAEKDCLPCKGFLQRLQRDRTESGGFEINVLWIENDPRSCLETSLKVQHFAKGFCVRRKEVETKWGVDSTPQTFWKAIGKKGVLKGSIDEKKSLPWRIMGP